MTNAAPGRSSSSENLGGGTAPRSRTVAAGSLASVMNLHLLGGVDRGPLSMQHGMEMSHE